MSAQGHHTHSCTTERYCDQTGSRRKTSVLHISESYKAVLPSDRATLHDQQLAMVCRGTTSTCRQFYPRLLLRLSYTPGTPSARELVALLSHLGEPLVPYLSFSQPYAGIRDTSVFLTKQQPSPFRQLGVLTRQALTTRCSNELIAFSSARLPVNLGLHLTSRVPLRLPITDLYIT